MQCSQHNVNTCFVAQHAPAPTASNAARRPNPLAAPVPLARTLQAELLPLCMQISLLQQRVAANAYDGEAWELLVAELQSAKGQPGVADALKATLQTVVKQYPTAVRMSVGESSAADRAGCRDICHRAYHDAWH